MKKIIFLVVLFILLPCNVKANIICNDGTVSKSCNDCHQGCCSRHGGCSANPNSSNNSSNSYLTTKKNTTMKKVTTSSMLKTTAKYTTTKVNDINDEHKYNNDNETKDNDNDDDSAFTYLALLGGIGGAGYYITKKKGK